MSNYEKKINEMGIALPTPSAPVANYVGFVRSGILIFISGQLPMENGKLQAIGKVDIEVSVEEAKKAARLCAINIIAQLKLACKGDLDIKRGRVGLHEVLQGEAAGLSGCGAGNMK